MVPIGRIESLHGVQGELAISHRSLGKVNIRDIKALMLELMPGSFIPFFIQSLRETRPDEWLVQFEEIPTRDAAKALLHKAVCLPDTFTLEAPEALTWAVLEGCTLTDQDGITRGTVESVFENGPQWLLQVKNGQQEFLVPFSEAWVMQFSPATKQLQLNLPEGLFDL
jgi:16S rRNA processing protein RimM